MWSYTFKDLAVNSNGREIVYKLEEVAVEGYASSITLESDVFTITNTHTPEVTNITVIKIWDDADDVDGLRTGSVEVALYADGRCVDKVMLSQDNSWTYTFTDLAKYDNGKEISYTVDESDSITGYDKKISNDSNIFTITNVHVPVFTNISIKKLWIDNDNQDGVRPKDISVELLANGIKVDEVVLSANNDWSYTFNNLNTIIDGQKIVYSIKEVEVANYTSAITNNTNEFTITNTHTPLLTSLNITKVWEDGNNRDGFRPKDVKVVLYANGRMHSKVLVSQSNSWTATIDNLAMYEKGELISYTINEDDVPKGYTSSINGFTVTNTHLPEVTTINVNKVWNDSDNKDAKRPNSIIVELYANDEVYDRITLDESNNWRYSFNDLYVYDENNNKITYTVKEVGELSGYTGDILADGLDFTIINTHIPEVVNVSVTKLWEDNDIDIARPDNVTVILYADGRKVNQAVLDKQGNWYHVFTNLDKYVDGRLVEYSVEEIKVIDYISTITNDSYDFTITNSYEHEVVSIFIEKHWIDKDNIYHDRPDNITVYLVANNKTLGKLTLTAQTNWAGRVSNLPKYDDGKLINYTLVEADMSDFYTKIIDKTSDYSFNLTNRHHREFEWGWELIKMTDDEIRQGLYKTRHEVNKTNPNHNITPNETTPINTTNNTDTPINNTTVPSRDIPTPENTATQTDNTPVNTNPVNNRPARTSRAGLSNNINPAKYVSTKTSTDNTPTTSKTYNNRPTYTTTKSNRPYRPTYNNPRSNFNNRIPQRSNTKPESDVTTVILPEPPAIAYLYGDNDDIKYRLFVWINGEYFDSTMDYSEFVDEFTREGINDPEQHTDWNEEGEMSVTYNDIDDVPDDITIHDTEDKVPDSTSHVDKHLDSEIDEGELSHGDVILDLDSGNEYHDDYDTGYELKLESHTENSDSDVSTANST